MRFKLVAYSLIFAFSLESSQAWAWGEQGHNTICNIAVYLVRDPALKAFLTKRSEMMGHLCNIPDIDWRDRPNTKSGDATHFMNPQNLGWNAAEVPTDFTQIYAQFEGKVFNNTRFPDYNSSTPIHVADALGSNWWRTKQFYERAIYFGKGAVYEDGKAKDDLPYDVFTTQTPSRPTVAELAASNPTTYDMYQMIIAMGVMGHFVGDASQPLHNFSNYDGWTNGHGGIHAFYETDVVDQLSFAAGDTTGASNALGGASDLRTQVYQKALELQQSSPVALPSLAPGLDVVSRAKAVSVMAFGDADELYRLDQVLAPSKVVGGKHIPAKRPSAADMAPVFKPMIVKQMAIAALTLAELWDEIAKQSGNVPYKHYRSYVYPLDVEFIAPDYIDGKVHPVIPE